MFARKDDDHGEIAEKEHEGPISDDAFEAEAGEDEEDDFFHGFDEAEESE